MLCIWMIVGYRRLLLGGIRIIHCSTNLVGCFFDWGNNCHYITLNKIKQICHLLLTPWQQSIFFINYSFFNKYPNIVLFTLASSKNPIFFIHYSPQKIQMFFIHYDPNTNLIFSSMNRILNDFLI